MFCFNTVKADFSEKACRGAIYKAVLRGSERPLRLNAASGKKKRFVSRLKIGSIGAGTRDVAKPDLCVRVSVCVCVCLCACVGGGV